MKARCSWVNNDIDYINYHDNEWGIPVFDNLLLFEMLCLEGQQAGLSWITVLKKRAAYRELFNEFNPQLIANYSDEYLNEILKDSSIIRNRLKIYGIRKNAIAYIELNKTIEFSTFLWDFVNHQPIVNDGIKFKTKSTESQLMSKALKKHGFTFVGPTICYAFMQAAGMVNDHELSCFKR